MPLPNLWRLAAVLALLTSVLQSQTVTLRPKSSARGAFVQKQVLITTMTASYAYVPATTQPAGGNVYLGQDGPAPATGQIAVGSGAITVNIQDANGVKIVANGWALTANSTFNLNVAYGALMTGGFTLTCSDSSAGVACAASSAEMFWGE